MGGLRLREEDEVRDEPSVEGSSTGESSSLVIAELDDLPWLWWNGVIANSWVPRWQPAVRAAEVDVEARRR